MNTRKAYCSACDRDVDIAVLEAPVHEGRAPIPDGDVVCLDFGERCTGALCPLFELPKLVMGVRLARSGLGEGHLREVRAFCDTCERLVTMQVLDDQRGFCRECRSMSRMVLLRLDDDTSVTLAIPDGSD